MRNDPAGRPEPQWRPPLLWRTALSAAGLIVAPLCRLRVTGGADACAPTILAANHIGAFDPMILAAACAQRRIAPRILATGTLFDAPILGPALQAAGHLRVDRKQPNVIDALPAARRALAEGATVLAYPEGRISLDPGIWPERGRSGLARLALATGVPVVPVAQWGAQLIMPWGAPRGMLARTAWSVVRRPVVRVHFGSPVPLDDLSESARDVRRATDRIIDALTDEVAALRPDEPRLPAWIDPRRPVTTARRHRYQGSTGWSGRRPAA
jgi:1-acyl-sn-glycerol-3-phosphate acyltransferase